VIFRVAFESCTLTPPSVRSECFRDGARGMLVEFARDMLRRAEEEEITWNDNPACHIADSPSTFGS